MMMNNQEQASATQKHQKTVNDLLHWRANFQPEKPVFTFLSNGQAIDNITYGKLYRKARNVSTALDSFISPGERIILLYPQGIEFIIAFYGCLLAGGVAIPITIQNFKNIEESLGILEKIFENSRPPLVLTESRILSFAPRIFLHSKDLEPLQWLATDRIFERPILQTNKPASNEDVTISEYYPIRDGMHHGVNLSNRMILAINEEFKHTFDIRTEDIFINWLPPNTDLGLIGGLFHPVINGNHCYLMSQLEFYEKPVNWLKAISKYNCSVSAGPGSAYELCNQKFSEEIKLDLDLSRWNIAIAGLESFPKRTVEDFLKNFGIFGFEKSSFYPSYIRIEPYPYVQGCSITQAGCVVSFQKFSKRGKIHSILGTMVDQASLIGCECDNGLSEIRIVHPQQKQIIKDSVVGEITIYPSKSWNENIAESGVFEKPDQTRDQVQTIQNSHLTGDLGFRQDGFFYYVGDLENAFENDNLYLSPELIERYLYELLTCVNIGQIVVLKDDIGSELEIVIIIEVIDHDYKESKNIFLELRNSIPGILRKLFPLEVGEILLVKAGNVPLRMDGMVDRNSCLKKYKTGKYSSVLID